MPHGAVPYPFGQCRICNDGATGVHYGVATCEGCKGFFKRSITNEQKYKCFFGGSCQLTPQNRNRCKSCRFQRCLSTGMSVEAVKMGRIPKVDKERALEEARRGENQQPSTQQQQQQHQQQQQQQLPSMLPEGSMLDRFIYGDRPQQRQPHVPPDQPTLSTDTGNMSGPSNSDVGPMHPLGEEKRHNYPQTHAPPRQPSNHPPHQPHPNSNQVYPHSQSHHQQPHQQNGSYMRKSIEPYREKMYPQHAQMATQTKPFENQYSVEAQREAKDPHVGLHFMPQIKNEPSLRNCNGDVIPAQLPSPQALPAPCPTGASMNPGGSVSPNSSGTSNVATPTSQQAAMPDIIHRRVYSPNVIKELLSQVIEKKTVKEIPDPLLNKLITSIRSNRHRDILYQRDNCESMSSSSSGFNSANSYTEELLEKRKTVYHSEDELPTKLHRSNSVPYSNEEVIDSHDHHRMQVVPEDYRPMNSNHTDPTRHIGASQAQHGNYGKDNTHNSNLEGIKGEFDQYLKPERKGTNKSAYPLSDDDRRLESTIDQLKLAFENSFAEETRGLMEMIRKRLALPEDQRPKNFESDSIEDLKMIWNQLISSIPKISQKILVFSNGIPGFNDLDKEDQGKLIKDAYFDIWMITSSGYIQGGESYMLLDNGIFYSKFWMSRILPADLIGKMFTVAEGFNECMLTFSELSILCSVRLTDPGRSCIKNTKELKAINNHLLDCLAKEVPINHPENHSRILINIFRLLPTLDSLAEQSSNVIMNFSLQFSEDSLAGTGSSKSSSASCSDNTQREAEKSDDKRNKFDRQPVVEMSQ
ncbi:unnamed protein product [Owenia fusiformis]|uniref:Uncharacterized protein n=1 Tax=Owenia fusiformis TaxID=6347 RepID=A0A8J1UDM7_OWEFU|nr:unnamed protein product [Owenia fusiformis]